MPVTDSDFQDLKKRVGRLEKASVENTGTITWLAGTLGTMKAVQDDHTQRLDRIETRLEEHDNRFDEHDARFDRLDKTLHDLTEALPGIVSNAMREVLKTKG